MNLSSHEIITLLATLLGGGIGVSLLAKLTKKYAKIEGEVLHIFVVALSGGAAVLQYIYQLHAVLPPAILGVSVPALYGYSQLLYRYASKVSGFASQYQLKNTKTGDTVTTDAAATNTVVVGPSAEPDF